MKHTLTFIVIGLIIAACGVASEQAAAPTVAPTLDPTLAPTETSTPDLPPATATLTLVPTSTPIPPATETPVPEPTPTETEAAAEIVEPTAMIEVPTETPTSEPTAEATPTEVVEAVQADAPVAYVVDVENSEVIWVGDYAIRSGHTGTINIAEGELNFEGTTLTGGTVVIDMTSMEATSLSGNRANRLVNHLMNADFFEVTTYPTAVLELKSAEPTEVESQYQVTADLTIKDITDEIVYITDVTVGDGRLTATTDLEFDRTKWNVVYNSGSIFDGLGDRVIKDEIGMQVMLVANISE